MADYWVPTVLLTLLALGSWWLLGWMFHAAWDTREMYPTRVVRRLLRKLLQRQSKQTRDCRFGWHHFGVVEMSAGYMHVSQCERCGAPNPRQGSIAPWDLDEYL